VEHGAEPVEVAPGVEGSPLELFRSHVGDLPLDGGAGGAELGLQGGHRDAEVGELHLALPGEQQIARRDIPMDQPEEAAVGTPLPMGVIEPLERLEGDEEHGGEG
jgi:hypothetical protein